MTDDERKHLEFVQAAITRMANNSFLLKGWTVTLTAAVIGLVAKETKPELVLIAFVPALAFWGLDAYYLTLERRFRKLYEELISPHGKVAAYAMNPQPYKKKAPSVLRTMFAGAVIWLHMVVLAAIVAVFLFLRAVK